MPYKNPRDPRLLASKKAYRESHKEESKAWREAHPDYLKDWYKNNPDRAKMHWTNSRKRYLSDPGNRTKDLARQKVRYAVRTGKLIRPEQCSKCDSTVRIEADHHDYSKPLDITWLCHKCHLAITMLRKQVQ